MQLLTGLVTWYPLFPVQSIEDDSPHKAPPQYEGSEGWLLEDYRVRTREIETRLGLRQALLNYSALAFAGAGALLAFTYQYFNGLIPATHKGDRLDEVELTQFRGHRKT